MKVGITGSRYGLLEDQKPSVAMMLGFLLAYGSEFGKVAAELHHGDCIGVDEWAHRLLRSRNYGVRIIVHPPDNPGLRAYCDDGDETRVPLPYLERNHRIVDACEVLVAVPYEHEEVLRSGTWTTVRYARERFRPIVIIWPEGRATYENWPGDWEKLIKERAE